MTDNTIGIFPDKTQAVREERTIGTAREEQLLRKARKDGSKLLNSLLDGKTEVSPIKRYPSRSVVASRDN